MTAGRHALRGLDTTLTDKSVSRSDRYAKLFSIGAILVAIGVVAVVIVLLRPPLRTPEDTVKYWTFDQQAYDSGYPLLHFGVIERGESEGALAVGPEGLTHGAALIGDYASYIDIQREFPGPVDRIGVTATFPTLAADATSGAVALLVSSQPIPTRPELFDSGLPNMGIHFAFDAHIWVMGVWRQHVGQEVLGSGQFTPALTGDRSVEIVRRSDEVTVFLPDGQSPKFRSPNIASWSGNRAAWELYEKAAGTTPAVIHRLWVGWRGQ